MNNNKNMLIFVDAANTAYMNSADNFRGVSHAADDKLQVFFKAAAIGDGGTTSGYDKIILSVTDEKEIEAMRGIAAAVAGAKTPYVTVADDVNSVYSHENITAVDSITLSAVGTFKTVTALTSATNLEREDSGKVFTLTQASAHSHTLPTAADAGAGWNAKFILVTAGGNAVKVIPDSTEDTIIGMIPPSDDGTAGTSAESGVDEIVWVASTAAAGDWVEVVCDGSNFYASGGMHDNDHITIS